MTSNVITVAPDTRVEEIARLLLERRISAVPVITPDGRIVGIVSEGDLMRRPEIETERRRSWWLGLVSGAEAEARDYVKSHGLKAADVMTTQVIAVGEDSPVGEIARLLEERRVKRVPVLRDGRLVGIVSRANLLQGLAVRAGAPAPAASGDDSSLRARIVETIERQGWVTHGSLNPIVSDGVVELWGWVDSDDERRAIRVATEQVPGVREVIDHLGRIPPAASGA